MADAVTSLKPLQLATMRFGDISPAEKKLLGAAAIGQEADCTSLSDGRAIRGELLRWLCTDPEASAQVTYRGVSIVGAKIDGKLDLKWASLSFPLRTRMCVFNETISLETSHLVSLDLSGSSIKDLAAASAKIDGGVFLQERFKAEGAVNLAGATIGGNLECDSGQFVSKSKALNAYGAKIGGSVFFRQDFKAEGAVDLRAVTIGQNLVCDSGQFVSKNELLNIEAAKIEGDVLFRQGFKAEGGVDLSSATIGGQLDCSGGQFVSQGRAPALNAEGVKIEHGAFFSRKATVDGEVRLSSAEVGRDFQWKDLESPEKASLDLRFTKVGTLLNHRDSWPRNGNLRINGFVYNEIDYRASPNAKTQLGWLSRQPRDRDRFLSQPYEQLATVFGKMGLEEDARKVMIEKNKEHARYVRWRPEWLWYGFFGKITGYGYRRWRAFWISIVLIVIGSWFFSAAYKAGIMTPTERSDRSVTYPVFNPLVYSVEEFMPLPALGIKEHWAPSPEGRGAVQVGALELPLTGGFLCAYLWLHIIAGWILTPFWLVGLTGAKT
jgi:hypothetical protein